MVIVRMRKSRLKEIKFLFQSHRASGDTGKSPKSGLTCLMLLLPMKNAHHVLENAALAAANRVSSVKNNSFYVAVPHPFRELWKWSLGAQLDPFSREPSAGLSR